VCCKSGRGRAEIHTGASLQPRISLAGHQTNPCDIGIPTLMLCGTVSAFGKCVQRAHKTGNHSEL